MLPASQDKPRILPPAYSLGFKIIDKYRNKVEFYLKQIVPFTYQMKQSGF